MVRSFVFGLTSALIFVAFSYASDPEHGSLAALYEQFDQELSYKPIPTPVLVGGSVPSDVPSAIPSTVKPLVPLHKMDQDVHKFNVQGIKKGDFVRAILPFDTETFDDLTAEAVWSACEKEEGMEAPTIAPKKATLENSFKILQQHIKGSAIETRETQLPVEKILSRVWSIILMEQNEAERISKLEEFSQVMCDHLGCYEGYAGRIAHLYITWMRSPLGF
ncbi:MAG: hypothetical protein ACK5TR_02175 [Alphaproteobacteria bacterium]|jgi:hypothetical protein|nr:hypothetical protein [Alphaproteobacteria bacterium]